jgi:hypothetical protein
MQSKKLKNACFAIGQTWDEHLELVKNGTILNILSTLQNHLKL